MTVCPPVLCSVGVNRRFLAQWGQILCALPPPCHLYAVGVGQEGGLAPRGQETIEDVEEMLNNLPGVTSVHSRFYDLSSKYYQTVGSHASYYKDALRFLGCVDIKDLPGNPDARPRPQGAGAAGPRGHEEARVVG